MTKDELISKQQLEIEDYKERIQCGEDILKHLHGLFYSVGQPLNENRLKMNVNQLTWVANVKTFIDKLDYELRD